MTHLPFALRAATATLLWSWAAAAGAAPIPSALQITASVALDLLNSVAPGGDALQDGRISQRVGGVLSSSSFDTDPQTIAPQSAYSALLTQTGDGVGASFLLHSLGGPGSTPKVGADFTFHLANTSLVDSYSVSLLVDYANVVEAAGADAYAKAKLSVFDALNNEIFFTDHGADTVYAVNNFSYDSASNLLTFLLAPGAIVELTAGQTQEGALSDGTGYRSSLSAFLQIDSVTGGPVTPPPGGAVPLPGTLALLLPALAALGRSLRRPAHA